MADTAYRLARHVVDGCWTLFAIFWLVAATSTKKTAYRPPFLEGGLSRVFLFLMVAVFLVSYRSVPLKTFLLPHATATAAAAAIVCVIGLAFTLWARVALGRNWSGWVVLKENHELIERGPYRIVRHPIYTGILTMALGTAMLSGTLSGLAGWAVIAAALWIKSAREERLLVTRFPSEYPAYQRRVKRIIPFVLSM